MQASTAGAARQPARDGKIGWIEFAVIAFQLVLLLVVIRQFQIENAGFRLIAQFAFAGFVVHAFLPLHWRLPFFAALSVAGTGLVLGAVNLAWMLVIGAALVGICHLPVSFGARVFLLLAAGGALAAQRAGGIPIPWSEAIWPILGSMFMFRLILYFHALRYDKAPTTPARTIAYFFMLPNASFPLFPVVDYQAFRRDYYDRDAYRIYQTGVDWILRGIVHLLLYRLVYYHLTLTPAEVDSPERLMQYLVANILLYLKVSGLFHLIVGMLYLFGFRLPETHNRYFLAAGFTDYYRRINIYWRDFMQKVFYNPMVFRLKHLGTEKAIFLATIWVFFLTWALHAYQWFWIRGTSLIVTQDMLYWAMLSVLVSMNALWEIRYGRSRSLGKPKFSWHMVGMLTLKSYATFWLICVMWSYWTCDSISDWLAMWQPLATGEYTLAVLTWPVVTLVVIFLGNIPRTKAETEADPAAASRAWLRERAVTVAGAFLLIGLSLEPVFSNFGPQVSTVVHSLRHGSLSRLDAAKLERGYYEGLTEVNRFNSQLWETYAARPTNWLDNQGAGLKRYVGGFAQTENIPSFIYDTSYGPLTTNRWGMRDRDYAENPAPNTFRAALLGPSIVMGWGVADDATFDAILEERLNRELTGEPFARYELLNYGVQGYQPPQQLTNFERALALNPNAVIYFATGRETSRSAAYMAEVVRKRIDIPYPPLREIVEKAGVTAGMSEAEAKRRLAPHAGEILAFVYGRIVQTSKERGIQPIWVFLPQPDQGEQQEETPGILKIAGQAGFIVIDLDDLYRGTDVRKVRLADWDYHPNAQGHRLIAERLFERMRDERRHIFASGAFAAAGKDRVLATEERK